jgi:regulator of protease activity HflC (stomatin/prohibitin superfamily)
VFRLGKMIGVKGPGRVLIFPWMDRTKWIDVRAAAFAVPPQQFITCDGGIVEMGAEIQVTLLRAILNFTPGPKG